jgi:hypothetical protein
MFYVYEWFIVSTLEVFYVGKGTGMRRFETHNRSLYFKNVTRKHACAVRLVHQSLTNEESCMLEIERIAELRMKGWARCNFTNGGTGFSTGELNPTRRNPHFGNANGMLIHNIDFSGDKNPFYGRQHSERTRQRISTNRKGKGGRFGPDNPAFGKVGNVGSKNGMFGRTGIKHPNSKIYEISYIDGTNETLKYKDCEKKFGIAFLRIYEGGGVLEYKKKTPNAIYAGAILRRVK